MAAPGLAAWTEATQPLRLVEPAVPKGEPKALACYGALVRGTAATPGAGAGAAEAEAVWLRFVDGRPVSDLTVRFLAWCGERAAAAGATALVWVWDNASWHLSREVRAGIRAHNQRAHREGGARIVPCWLPSKSPWLNPIEPKWMHGKRRVAGPARLLPAAELEARICAALGADHADHLALPQKVA